MAALIAHNLGFHNNPTAMDIKNKGTTKTATLMMPSPRNAPKNNWLEYCG